MAEDKNQRKAILAARQKFYQDQKWGGDASDLIDDGDPYLAVSIGR